MKIEFITTGEKIEKVNYLLSLAIDAARDNELFRQDAGLSLSDLSKMESFRKQMLRGYFKKFKSGNKNARR
jgi:hypothetical protein